MHCCGSLTTPHTRYIRNTLQTKKFNPFKSNYSTYTPYTVNTHIHRNTKNVYIYNIFSNSIMYLWFYMYTPEVHQPRPKHVAFLILYNKQIDSLVHSVQSLITAKISRCSMVQKHWLYIRNRMQSIKTSIFSYISTSQKSSRCPHLHVQNNVLRSRWTQKYWDLNSFWLSVCMTYL
jgi:hypothetical protein